MRRMSRPVDAPAASPCAHVRRAGTVATALALAPALPLVAACTVSREPAPAKAPGAAPAAAPRSPRPSLGDHTYKITTSSPEAQAAFDRGLTLAYGFSHEAAQVQFHKAAEV